MTEVWNSIQDGNMTTWTEADNIYFSALYNTSAELIRKCKFCPAISPFTAIAEVQLMAYTSTTAWNGLIN